MPQRTASPSDAPAASHTAWRLRRHWRVCSPMSPSTSWPVPGSSGVWPDRKRKPPERTAWLYGPTAAGASWAVIGWRSADMSFASPSTPVGDGRYPPPRMPARRLRSPARTLVSALGACMLLTIWLGAGSASADLPWTPCPPAADEGPTTGYECASLGVPLDRGGAVGGTVSLGLSRVAAASNPTRTAVVPLAGGPGQAALPLAQDFAAFLAPALASRDLLVFDQRGTGSSGALSCSSLSTRATVVTAAAGCAGELGAARAFYRTADSVADIEALRVAGGYDKLVLFGVS